MRILLVDDEPELTAPLERVLSNQGYGVTVVNRGDQGLELAQQSTFQLLVLDWILPAVTGVEICQRLRHRGDDTPILLLTARDTLDDRVLGLDSGADDYLVKPFELRELLARVRALLRRFDRPNDRLNYGDLQLDIASQVAYRNGLAIPLSDKETQLLAYLMRFPNQLLTHQQISCQLWADCGEPPASNALVAQVRLLRKKIDHPTGRSLVNTVYGKGYRFG